MEQFIEHKLSNFARYLSRHRCVANTSINPRWQQCVLHLHKIRVQATDNIYLCFLL